MIEELDDKLKESNVLGLIIDETMNITVDKKLIMYLKLKKRGKDQDMFPGHL